MNAQSSTDMLALQHLLGLKHYNDASSKLKPKDYKALDSLKEAEPVFVCVDLEAYELDNSKITEVGLSFLDTRKVIGSDPGPNGSNWISQIVSSHFIISEYSKLVNKRFVHGCPDKFNFGKSMNCKLNRIHHTLTWCFANPGQREVDKTEAGNRKMILVGHGLSNDTAFLKKLDFDPHRMGNVLKDIDTQKLAGSSKKRTTGLSRMLAGLGAKFENLHNAGNDAAYTLQALVMMAVQHTADPGAYLKAISTAVLPSDEAKRLKRERREAWKAKVAAEEAANAEADASAEIPGRETTTPSVSTVVDLPSSVSPFVDELKIKEDSDTLVLPTVADEPEMPSEIPTQSSLKIFGDNSGDSTTSASAITKPEEDALPNNTTDILEQARTDMPDSQTERETEPIHAFSLKRKREGYSPTEVKWFKPFGRRGDWECGGCGRFNFARNTECKHCHSSRANAKSIYGGKDAVTSSSLPTGRNTTIPFANDFGLPDAQAKKRESHNTNDDRGLGGNEWVCSHKTCHYRNRATRSECRRCGAPRPIVEDTDDGLAITPW